MSILTIIKYMIQLSCQGCGIFPDYISLFLYKSCPGRDPAQFAQLSRQGIDLIDRSFGDQGDDAEGPFPERYALPAYDDGSMMGQNIIQLMNVLFVLDQDDDGADSLFHWKTFGSDVHQDLC